LRSLEKFSGVCREETVQQAAGARIPGDLPWRGVHESARPSNNRLSAPVSARSLLPKKLQPGILDFVTQKYHPTPECRVGCAVIRVYDEEGKRIETRKRAGEFKER
jgi:hypothetical protein